MFLRYTILIIVFIWSFFFIDSLITTGNISTIAPKFTIPDEEIDQTFYQFLPILDTIYILSSSFIEIRLTEQKVILRRRDSSDLVFPISTGSSSIHKGMETPEGIYTVQSKYPQAISKQFNNAKLFNWIGFNGNIGFHGLESISYERLLGIRPSSHGCVRISNKDGEILYNQVKIGTPVIAYKDEPARILVFSDMSKFRPNQDLFLSNCRQISSYMKTRLKNLYSGNAHLNIHRKVFLDGENPLARWGFGIGNANKIPTRQNIPNFYSSRNIKISDKLQNNKYFLPADSSIFAMN